MKTDIILCGVGGQGILSIATVIGQAAMNENLYIKQAEVHGMSQRGGDVQSNLPPKTIVIRAGRPAWASPMVITGYLANGGAQTKLNNVDFPEPFSPLKAHFSPHFTVQSKSFKMVRSP